MQRFKLTKTLVESFPVPAAGYTIYRDTELRGFGLRVTSTGVRSYFVERAVAGRNVRATVGKHGDISAAEARIKAQSMLASMAAGSDPVAERKAELAALKAAQVTFGQVAGNYVEERLRMGLKPRTAEDYQYDLNHALASLKPMLLAEIERKNIATLQERLTEDRGPTTANRAMRFARAVFNYAVDNEDFVDADGEPLLRSNPVSVLKTRRLWNPVNRRHGYLDERTLGRWLDAVLSIDRYRWSEFRENAERRALNAQGYLLVMACLGLRSGEAARLRIEDWDAERKTLTITDPKNIASTGKVFVTPVGWRLAQMIEQRAAQNTQWVFCGEDGQSSIASSKTGPRAIIADVSTRGAEFSPHDLRRTFASIVNSLVPAPSAYQIKRLLNHTPDRDVTTEYIQHNIETLRSIVQRVEDVVFESGSAFLPLRQS